MPGVTDEEWAGLWSGVREVAGLFPEGVAFIGGVAVFARMKAREDLAKYAAYSHDADLVIARADFMDLRDVEVVTSNRRLQKHEFVKSGVQYDVYVEGTSGLIVPVPEIIAGSQDLDGVRVAAPEHLLVLKLEAFRDRKGSGKGDKDADDIYRILLSMEDREIIGHRLAHMTSYHEAELTGVRRSPAALSLTGGNQHEASALNRKVDRVLTKVTAAMAPPALVRAPPASRRTSGKGEGNGL